MRSTASDPQQYNALRICTLLLAFGALAIATPLWVALVLGAWFAMLARPLHQRMSKVLGGRYHTAAILTVALLLFLVAPLVLAGASLFSGALDYGQRILSSESGKQALRAIVSDQVPRGEPLRLRVEDVMQLVQEHGSRAWQVLRVVAGATTRVLLGLFVFLLTSYTLLIHGAAVYAWMKTHLPLHPAHLQRFAGAFNEAGRGLIVGVGLTALVQGVLATGIYLILGIPSAFTLGLLTAIAAMVPTVGTALVWIPAAAGLALSDRWVAALVLVAFGVLVIGTVDNVLRPLLSRYGRLEMPTLVLFVAIFGGLFLVGAWGFILGPLVVRLAMEALEMWSEEPPMPPPMDETPP